MRAFAPPRDRLPGTASFSRRFEHAGGRGPGLPQPRRPALVFLDTSLLLPRFAIKRGLFTASPRGEDPSRRYEGAGFSPKPTPGFEPGTPSLRGRPEAARCGALRRVAAS